MSEQGWTDFLAADGEVQAVSQTSLADSVSPIKSQTSSEQANQAAASRKQMAS